ncbi:MAG: ABC transporter substrate-binding protein, partial [Flavobacteriales bacterium]
EYMRENENRERSLMYEPTRQSMDFYHGVKLALDSLAQSGLNVSLIIYDTARDTVALRKICENLEFSELDLIIGPTENVELVGRYAKKYRIPMVCPVAYSNRVLLDNPFIFKMIGSASVMADKASQFIVNNYKDQNIIIIDGKGKSDIGIVKAYKKYLNRYLMKETGTKDSVKVLAMDYFTMKTLEGHINPLKKNVIVIPTNDFAYVSVAMSNLNKYLARYNHKTIEVIVFGTEDWLKMEEIDVTYKLRAQVHIPSPSLVDYDTLQTQQLIRSYRNDYKTDPDKYALMGFDISYFWLAGYLKYGIDFNAMVTQYDLDLVQTGMRFMRLNETSGYLNSNVYMLKYENYKLIPQKQ